MLRNHQKLWDGRLGHLKGIQHKIPTVGEPTRQQPYRCGLRTRDLVNEEIERMKSLEIIEPSTSEWAAPIVLIPKPDGSLRFCIDYRKLNALTVRDCYPLPRMDDCLDSLGEATIFSTLDANSGYWQLDVAEEDRDKTTFTSHRGTFRFTRMPFGLVNAPATFQRAMDVLLSNVLWQSAIVYLDDIIIFSRTPEQHIHDVDRVLSLLQEAGISLNMRKCALFRSRVDYLGHVVQPGCLTMAANKSAAVSEWEFPRTKAQMRSFVAFCSVYRRFVFGFARIASPLNRTLKKDEPEAIPRTEELIKAFGDLRSRMINPPVLTLPTKNDKFTIETDASNVAIGAVLLVHRGDGAEQPAAYLSRSVSAPERNYSVTEREALAVVWATKQLRPYLERTEFLVRTDHAALRWLFTTITENQRICRWRLALSEFRYIVEHRPGRKHVAPDSLSRLPARHPEESDLDLEPPVLVVEVPVEPPPTRVRNRRWLELTKPLPALTFDMVYRAQSLDAWCREMAVRVESGLRGYGWTSDGLIFKESEYGRQILVPSELREVVLHLAHLPPRGAHPGGRRMFHTVARGFFWPSLARDCARYVSECLSCSAVKPMNNRTRNLQLFPPSGPWEFICSDILGPLPVTADGNRYVLVFSDRFSKFTVALAMKQITANDVAEAFVQHWVANFGVPLILLTDNGPQYASKFLQQVSAILGVQQRFTSAYHPAANGQAERFNRTLLAMLSHYVGKTRSWDKCLGPVLAAYNATVHTSTGFAPHEFIRATAPRILPQNFEVFRPPDKGAWRRDFIQRISIIGSRAKETLERAQNRYKEAYDAHVRMRNALVCPGDFVLVRVYTDSPKLTLPLAGPFKVKAVDHRNGTYVIETREGPTRVHSDRIRPAPVPRDLPEGVRLPVPPPDEPVESDAVEYVIDRLVSHGKDERGRAIARVRWAGYDDSDDTWELMSNIPKAVVDRYARRKRVSVYSLND